jgi:hypothetical protein
MQRNDYERVIITGCSRRKIDILTNKKQTLALGPVTGVYVFKRGDLIKKNLNKKTIKKLFLNPIP